MNLPQTFEGLVEEANALHLYEKLIVQLNKDLRYANVNIQFETDILPTSLKLLLQETVFSLINDKFMDYLNLLYIVDVSEKKVKELDGMDTFQLAEEVTFLILQREWQKVWFKNKFS